MKFERYNFEYLKLTLDIDMIRRITYYYAKDGCIVIGWRPIGSSEDKIGEMQVSCESYFITNAMDELQRVTLLYPS